MNSKNTDDFLLLIQKNTDLLINQTKTKPYETLDFKLPKATDTLSINTPQETEE